MLISPTRNDPPDGATNASFASSNKNTHLHSVLDMRVATQILCWHQSSQLTPSSAKRWEQSFLFWDQSAIQVFCHRLFTRRLTALLEDVTTCIWLSSPATYNGKRLWDEPSDRLGAARTQFGPTPLETYSSGERSARPTLHSEQGECKASWMILCNQHNAPTMEPCCSYECRGMRRRQHNCVYSFKRESQKRDVPISSQTEKI